MTTTSTTVSTGPVGTAAPAVPQAPATATAPQQPGPAAPPTAPARPRTVAGPRRPGPASYPEAARRPGVRKVRVGGPTRRRVVDDELEDDAAARPIRAQDPAPLPDPTAQCCSVVRAAVEVLRDERPASQLARWVTPQVRDQLAERARLLRIQAGTRTGAVDAPASRPVLVRRVRLVRLGEDVAEATVVLDDDGRVRAAAVRLEARRGTWRVAVLEIG